MTKESPLFASFADRSAVLRQSRDLKMAGSAHAYVRGNTLKFYERLAKADIQKVPNGPPVVDLWRLPHRKPRTARRHRWRDQHPDS
jgi:hypothetical protein